MYKEKIYTFSTKIKSVVVTNTGTVGATTKPAFEGGRRIAEVTPHHIELVQFIRCYKRSLREVGFIHRVQIEGLKNKRTLLLSGNRERHNTGQQINVLAPDLSKMPIINAKYDAAILLFHQSNRRGPRAV